MTEEFAIGYIIPGRLEELGYGKNYLTPKCRHFSLYAGEIRTIDAYNEYFFLIHADIEIAVNSEFGSYNLNDDTINEQQYEHQGKIILTNNSGNLKHIKFIQVIPKHI